MNLSDWWPVLIFLTGLAGGLIASAVAVVVWIARATWWLSEQFKATRHDFSGRIDAAVLKLDQKIDAVDDRDIREHDEMKKQLTNLALQIAKRH